MQKKDEIVKSILAGLVTKELITGYAYDHFTQADPLAPPFALYRRVVSDNFSADGKVYHRGDSVDLEIYADTPEDMAVIMDEAERLMDEEELFWRCGADTTYIESENYYETLYEL